MECWSKMSYWFFSRIPESSFMGSYVIKVNVVWMDQMSVERIN